jgi:hypothetical protein
MAKPLPGLHAGQRPGHVGRPSWARRAAWVSSSWVWVRCSASVSGCSSSLTAPPSMPVHRPHAASPVAVLSPSTQAPTALCHVGALRFVVVLRTPITEEPLGWLPDHTDDGSIVDRIRPYHRADKDCCAMPACPRNTRGVHPSLWSCTSLSSSHAPQTNQASGLAPMLPT